MRHRAAARPRPRTMARLTARRVRGSFPDTTSSPWYACVPCEPCGVETDTLPQSAPDLSCAPVAPKSWHGVADPRKVAWTGSAGVVTTQRRRSFPPWGTHGPGGVRFPYFFSLDGRSPVSHPTCEVPFPPRRSGEYRKGMIPARPLYQGGCGSVWDPEPSKERVGDWGGPATVWSLLCVAETRATRPNGEWGYSTRRQCWATSAQRRCHPEEALYLPTFSHLFDCQ